MSLERKGHTEREAQPNYLGERVSHLKSLDFPLNCKVFKSRALNLVIRSTLQNCTKYCIGVFGVLSRAEMGEGKRLIAFHRVSKSPQLKKGTDIIRLIFSLTVSWGEFGVESIPLISLGILRCPTFMVESRGDPVVMLGQVGGAGTSIAQGRTSIVTPAAPVRTPCHTPSASSAPWLFTA